jgi:CDP-diacylglycerol--serine O-phosphatidyltransferase
MQSITKHIPNALTSLNLVLGCFAIMQALNGSLYMAAYLIVAAAVIDFFDGFVARLLHAQSPIGEQLDSLADVVSFGVAPGFIFYQFAGVCLASDSFCITPYFAFLIPVFSAIRLAKFNIDKRQIYGFIGLPTPANALLIASIPFVVDQYMFIKPYTDSQIFLRAVPMLSAYLLTSEIHMLSLKFQSASLKDNYLKILLVVIGAVSIALFRETGVAISMLAYIFISIITHYINTKSATT